MPMDSTSMFDTLLKLPLFQGVSLSCMAETVGRVKFHFIRFDANAEIFRSGDTCSKLTFILSGKVRIAFPADGHLPEVSLTLSAPDVIMPEFLFGRHTHYPCTVTAVSEVSIMQIDKTEYMKLLALDSVFVINILNYLSSNAQKATLYSLHVANASPEALIAFIVYMLTPHNSTDITIHCLAPQYIEILGDNANPFVNAIHQMQRDGLIVIENDYITIKDRKYFLRIASQSF